jgi:hypothetical protein
VKLSADERQRQAIIAIFSCPVWKGFSGTGLLSLRLRKTRRIRATRKSRAEPARIGTKMLDCNRREAERMAVRSETTGDLGRRLGKSEGRMTSAVERAVERQV